MLISVTIWSYPFTVKVSLNLAQGRESDELEKAWNRDGWLPVKVDGSTGGEL